jgi:hypothetical protein
MKDGRPAGKTTGASNLTDDLLGYQNLVDSTPEPTRHKQSRGNQRFSRE